MASHGPALSHLTVLPCPALHRAISLRPHLQGTIHPCVHFSTPRCFHSWSQLLTLSSHTAPSSSCAIDTHTLPLPRSWLTMPSPWFHRPLCPFLVSSEICPLPGALSCLDRSGGSSCPQDPPPLGGPPPCLLSQQLLPFHLSAHSCSHVGLFLGGTEPRQLPGEQARARKGARAKPGERRERGGQGADGEMGPGSGSHCCMIPQGGTMAM